MQTIDKPTQRNHLMHLTGRLYRFLILCLILSLLSPTSGVQAQTPIANDAMSLVPYTMIDLGTLGGNTSAAVSINNAGQVIGNAETTTLKTHAFLWEGEGMKDLGTLGGRDSIAVDINDAGQVVGYSTLADGSSHTFLWQDGVMTDLGTLGGSWSYPVAINETGQVIGYSQTTSVSVAHYFLWDGAMIDLYPVSPVTDLNDAGKIVGSAVFRVGENNQAHAVVRDGGVIKDLGTLGGTNSSAVAINEAGQVIGGSTLVPNNSYDHAFIWRDGAMTDLGTLGGSVSRAAAINEAGQVVGHSTLLGNDFTYHGFIWENGVMKDLGTLGGSLSWATAINKVGQVVGVANREDGNRHAFVWQDGAMTDLGTLGGNTSEAYAINDQGLVIGSSLLDNNTAHAFLAKPATNTSIYILGETQQVSYNESVVPQVSYSVYLAPHQSMRKSFAGINSGPVEFGSTQSMIAAERVIYKVNGVNTSFSEMMAVPHSQLDYTYWLPWYNNVDLDTQLRFANPLWIPATVHVYIGTQEMSGSPFTLTELTSTRKSFPGINSGPVKIESDRPIVAAERVIYKVNGTPTSYSETMGLPASQLNTTYWLPWYNNVDLDTQLRFANVSDSPAAVHVYIGTQEMSGSPFTLARGASTRQSFAGINKGPVKIVSDVPIVAAERVIYKVNGLNRSFSEMMGLPANQLDNTYWLPWYNNVDLDTQLRFANVSDAPATVHVYVGESEMPGSPISLAAGASTRKSFPGANNGPVKIESNVNIVAAERVIYKVNGVNTSFSEMMGLPNNQLNTAYWLPWYNNVDLDTQLRFGIP